MKNILIGGVIAVITAILIIFIIESGRSILQFAIGFLLFVLPVTFISSFNSKVMSFLLVVFSIFIFYIILKFNYIDAIWGIFLAVLIGGSIFYLRIARISPFHPNEYKVAAMEKKEAK